MMSPGDSDLQKRIVNAFINYFLKSETSEIAVTTTLESLLAMEQEYNIHDNTSWTAILTSKVTVPFSIGKVEHLEKIKKCKHALENSKKHPEENLGKSAIKILLEFFNKSEDWHVRGFIKGAAINMRLTCEILKAAGIKEDCGLFLQKYSTDFLKELEAAADKFSSAVAVAPAIELLRTAAVLENRESAQAPITPLKDSQLFDGSHKRLFYIVKGQGTPSYQTTGQSASSNHDSLAFTLD